MASEDTIVRTLWLLLICTTLTLAGPQRGWAEDTPKEDGSPKKEGAGGKPPGGGPPPAAVVLAEIRLEDVKESRTFSGTVEAKRMVQVDAEASGFVELLDVELGDLIEEGNTIARLRTTTLDLRIDVAKKELLLREKEVEELKNGSRKEERLMAAAVVEERKAEVSRAAFVLAANKKLQAEKRISADELQQAASAHEVAKARLAAAEAQLELVEAGPREEDIAQAEARVAIQNAEIARLDDELKRHEITAPFTGFVTAKHVEKGAWLQTGSAVVELVELHQVDVVVPVLEDFVSQLKQGMEVPLEIDALESPTVMGKVHRIVPQANRRTRTVPVRIRLDNVIENGTPRIKIGMFVRVAFAVGKPAKSLTVPKDALTLGGPMPMIFVVDKNTMMATPAPVRLGASQGERIEVFPVSGGIEAGKHVVTRGNERLRPPFPTPVRETR